jgi:hypothetical protein
MAFDCDEDEDLALARSLQFEFDAEAAAAAFAANDEVASFLPVEFRRYIGVNVGTKHTQGSSTLSDC